MEFSERPRAARSDGGMLAGLRMPLLHLLAGVAATAGAVADQSDSEHAGGPVAVANRLAPELPDTEQFRERLQQLSKFDETSDMRERDAEYQRQTELAAINLQIKLLDAMRNRSDQVDYVISSATIQPERAALRDLGYGPALTVAYRYIHIHDDGTTQPLFGIAHFRIALEDAPALGIERGGLFLPHSFRFHGRAFEGERGAVGSETTHIHDAWHVVWDIGDLPSPFRQPIYGEFREGLAEDLAKALSKGGRYEHELLPNERLPARVPVSSSGCRSCHRTGNPFTLDFLKEHRAELFAERTAAVRARDSRRFQDAKRVILESNDNESIIPPEEWERPVTEQRGYRQYMQALDTLKVSDEFKARAAEALQNPRKYLRMPANMKLVLEDLRDRRKPGQPIIPDVGPDTPVLGEIYQRNVSTRNAVFTMQGPDLPELQGKIFLDAVERRLIEEIDFPGGLGINWDRRTIFPPQSRY